MTGDGTFFPYSFERRTAAYAVNLPFISMGFRRLSSPSKSLFRTSTIEVRNTDFCYESIPSDTSSASSTSIPRYLTGLLSFVWE